MHVCEGIIGGVIMVHRLKSESTFAYRRGRYGKCVQRLLDQAKRVAVCVFAGDMFIRGEY